MSLSPPLIYTHIVVKNLSSSHFHWHNLMLDQRSFYHQSKTNCFVFIKFGQYVAAHSWDKQSLGQQVADSLIKNKIICIYKSSCLPRGTEEGSLCISMYYCLKVLSVLTIESCICSVYNMHHCAVVCGQEYIFCVTQFLLKKCERQ